MQLTLCNAADENVQRLTGGCFSVVVDSDALFLVRNSNGERVQLAKADGHDHQPSHLERLSGREQTVFESLGRGLEMNDIATNMNVSMKTVETYRARIKHKLGIKGRAALLRMAVEHELLRRQNENSVASASAEC